GHSIGTPYTQDWGWISGVWVGIYPQLGLAHVVVIESPGERAYSWMQPLDTHDHSTPPYTPYKVKLFTSNGKFYTKIVGNHQNEADIPWVSHDYSYNLDGKLMYTFGMMTRSS